MWPPWKNARAKKGRLARFYLSEQPSLLGDGLCRHAAASETHPLKEPVMSPNHRLHRTFPVFLLLAALLLSSLPVQAAAARRPPVPAGKVSVLGEDALSWLRKLVIGWWTRGSAKEGVTIDPDGKPIQGASSDEGMSIDPNG